MLLFTYLNTNLMEKN